MTIQEYTLQTGAASNYPGWRHDTVAPITSPLIEESEKPKSNFFKNVINGARQLLTGGRLNAYESSNQKREKGPAYTDGSEYLPYGRFTPEIIHRFRMGNEFGSASYNDVFIDGFEDPAHLTFKVEFGEWGASILDDAVIAATQNQAIDTNVSYADYDQMPMGLLNLNFATDMSSAAMDQTSYNAYNYLCNKNEDRRALYLQDFVEGLYTVQRDFPYLFKSINGLDKLSDFDAKRGQRLKDVVLKLTCLSEGIDLKIRTLLELYRKAAWDDVYQRYVLPDIMRYFKMIVYVFEARSLQMGNGQFSPDQENFPIYAYELGPCEFVIDSHDTQEYTQDYSSIQIKEPVISIRVHNVKTYQANRLFQRVKFVGDILTKYQHGAADDVYLTQNNDIDWRFTWLQQMFMHNEEFKRFATWDPEFAGTAVDHQFADENDVEEFGLISAGSTIEVPYDLTWHYATVQDEGYQIRSLKGLWNAVKDIVTARTQLIRDSRQSDRYYFVNDLYHMDYSTFEYMYNQHMIALDVPGAEHDMVHRIKRMLKHLRNLKMDMDESKKHNNIDTSIDGYEPTEFKPELRLYETPSSKVMHDASIDGADKLEFEPQVVLYGEVPVPIQPGPELYETDVDYKLNAADVSWYPKVDFKPAPELEVNEAPKELHAADITGEDKAKFKPQPALVDTEVLVGMNAAVIDENPKANIKPDVHIINTPAPDNMKLANINTNSSLASMDLVHLKENDAMDSMSLASLDMTADIASVPMKPIDGPDELPGMSLAELDMNLSLEGMSLFEIEMNLEKMKQELANLQMNLDKPKNELQELDMDFSKRAQELAELIINLEKKVQQLLELDVNEDVPDMQLAEMNVNQDTPDMQLAEMEQTEETPDMQLAEIDVNQDTPDMQLSELDMSDEKPKIQMTELLEELSKARQQFQELIQDVHHVDMAMIENSSNASSPKAQLIPAYIDISVGSSKLTPMLDEIKLNAIDMTPQEQKASKANMPLMMQNVSAYVNDMELTPMNTLTNLEDMQLTPVDTSASLPKMRLTEQKTDTSLPDMALNVQLQNSSIAEMQMAKMKIDTSLADMQLNSLEREATLPDMQMAKMRLDASISDMQLANLDMKAERPKITMTNLDMKDETPDMQLANLDMSEEDPEIQMAEVEKDTPKADMQMQPQDLKAERADMDLIEGDLNTEKPNMQFIKLDVNVTQKEMDMIPQMKPDVHTTSINGGDIDVSVSKISTKEKQSRLESGRQKQPDEKPLSLSEKIDKLSRLNMDMISKAPMDELVKIIGAMEEVINDAQQHMKMNHIETVSHKTKNNQMMNMPVIEQTEIGSFLAKEMAPVDDEARERAERAYARANQKKKK